ncbi:MAG: alternative ribosome rescue aminoacyl-tRNA hydrolase ArfB [Chloroflexota bacterium]
MIKDSDTHIPITETVTIPMSELDFRYTTGGGPGGQHVNRSATRVALFFDVANTPSLDEATRARLTERLSNRLDSRGVLQITVHESRSQYRNRSIALQRFQTLLADAMHEDAARKPTRPSRRIRERRLTRKKRRSTVKRDRGRDWSNSE